MGLGFWVEGLGQCDSMATKRVEAKKPETRIPEAIQAGKKPDPHKIRA